MGDQIVIQPIIFFIKTVLSDIKMSVICTGQLLPEVYKF